MGLVKADLSLKNCAVFNDIVGGLVVELCQDGPVPFNRKERVVDQVFDENRSVIGFDDAAAALLSPVALGARVALSIDCLQYKWLEDPITFLYVGLPVSAFPPAKTWSVVLAVRLQ